MALGENVPEIYWLQTGEGTILNRVNAEVTVQKGTGRRVHRLSSPLPTPALLPTNTTRSDKVRKAKT